MKGKFKFLVFKVALISSLTLYSQEIPIEYFNMDLLPNEHTYSKEILKNEITGINVDHVAIIGDKAKVDLLSKESKFIYLFIKGQGTIVANEKSYSIVPETIFLPQDIQSIAINAQKNDTLHFLKIASKLTAQDLSDLKEFPKENTANPYFKKFIDCEAYTEPIKSPNTVSRTILPNKYIPRIAMGTVETVGPDAVGAHEHGMLEQLFLGLSQNNVVVYADDKHIGFPAYSMLHIPLGSSHSVKVDEGKKMYYVWMDFFRDKKGEEWLKTHNTVKKK